MKIKRVDHIGVIVRDANKAVSSLTELLGLKLDRYEESARPDGLYKLAFVPVVGDFNIEFVETDAKDGPIAKALESRGEGFHHIALEVEDIQEAVGELKARGAEVVVPVRPGSRGSTIAFLRHPSGGGVTLELVELPPELQAEYASRRRASTS